MMLSSSTLAAVPGYSVEVVAVYQETTTIQGASDAGHVVGWQVDTGIVLPYVATLADGLQLLPLPQGFISGIAFDVNSAGWIVGTVSSDGFPNDNGEPALWVPDNQGGYTAIVLERLASAVSAGQIRPISGGQATAINDRGDLLGYSRFQGFSGGPATRFSVTEGPENLAEQGLEATIRDVNELGVVVGDGIRFDLDTQTVTDLGIPPDEGGQSYIFVIAAAINDSNQVVAAAHRATSLPDRWKTYIHSDSDGWRAHNPAVLPSPFFGPYDNNNQGDVAAAGGIRFAAEDALYGSFNELLRVEDQHWDAAMGFIGDDRRVYTSATNLTTGELAIVQLNPGPAETIWADDFE
jgi:hypothetical protein